MYITYKILDEEMNKVATSTKLPSIGCDNVKFPRSIRPISITLRTANKLLSFANPQSKGIDVRKSDLVTLQCLL